MTTIYKDEMVHMAKKDLKPSVYDDERHISEKLRAMLELDGSLTVSNYGVKRRIFSTVTDHKSATILRMDDYSCPLVSADNVIGRIYHD